MSNLLEDNSLANPFQPSKYEDANEIYGNIYVVYAFTPGGFGRRERLPNPAPPSYEQRNRRVDEATVVTWNKIHGVGSIHEDRTGHIFNISLPDIGPNYGALIPGTRVKYQSHDYKFDHFWVDDDHFYVL